MKQEVAHDHGFSDKLQHASAIIKGRFVTLDFMLNNIVIDACMIESHFFSVSLQVMKKIILVTGGQRSGKSEYAEKLALGFSANPVYLATAHVWDDEFKERVIAHRVRRGTKWTNIEEEKYLSRHYIYNKVVVIDCITLWCTNFFFNSDANAECQPTVDEALNEIKAEFDLFTAQDAVFIFVTNEIGCGGISENAVQRRFTDMQGRMNQYVASCADEVVLMVSGIPVKIK